MSRSVGHEVGVPLYKTGHKAGGGTGRPSDVATKCRVALNAFLGKWRGHFESFVALSSNEIKHILCVDALRSRSTSALYSKQVLFTVNNLVLVFAAVPVSHARVEFLALSPVRSED